MSPTPPPNQKKKKPSRRSLQRLIRQLQRENYEYQEKIRALQHQASEHARAQPGQQVARPSGSAGDGFNLRSEMGLANNASLYRSIQRTVRTLVGNAGLDHKVIWRKQPKEVVVKLFRVARKRQPYLRRFVNDWATEEFVKQYLKNRRAYCKRMGYNEDRSELEEDIDMHHIDEGEDDDEREDGSNNGNDGFNDDEDRGEGPSGTSHDDDDD